VKCITFTIASLLLLIETLILICCAGVETILRCQFCHPRLLWDAPSPFGTLIQDHISLRSFNLAVELVDGQSSYTMNYRKVGSVTSPSFLKESSNRPPNHQKDPILYEQTVFQIPNMAMNPMQQVNQILQTPCSDLRDTFPL
jgi:hypothetical protein